MSLDIGYNREPIIDVGNCREYSVQITIVNAGVKWQRPLRGWSLPTMDGALHEDVATADMCKMFCLEETSFTCRAVVYGARGVRDCYLANQTRTQVHPQDWMSIFVNFDYHDFEFSNTTTGLLHFEHHDLAMFYFKLEILKFVLFQQQRTVYHIQCIQYK
ncbi:hypothetical protein NP493_705g02000 [Ridgeia piscesae]|uniref:Apple domain-containing protein n=1 Tax=Ridgeia piscesae TaxID=27915 RepID=A0AAD9NMJ6_RIDPI|nr:hypothetical protein NP493_705g02000 [Ridgeia piscesae]